MKTTIAACGIAPSGVIDWGSRCYHEHLQVFNGFGELPPPPPPLLLSLSSLFLCPLLLPLAFFRVLPFSRRPHACLSRLGVLASSAPARGQASVACRCSGVLHPGSALPARRCSQRRRVAHAVRAAAGRCRAGAGLARASAALAAGVGGGTVFTASRRSSWRRQHAPRCPSVARARAAVRSRPLAGPAVALARRPSTGASLACRRRRAPRRRQPRAQRRRRVEHGARGRGRVVAARPRLRGSPRAARTAHCVTVLAPRGQ